LRTLIFLLIIVSFSFGQTSFSPVGMVKYQLGADDTTEVTQRFWFNSQNSARGKFICAGNIDLNLKAEMYGGGSDSVDVVIRGLKRIEIDGEMETVTDGDSVLIEKIPIDSLLHVYPLETLYDSNLIPMFHGMDIKVKRGTVDSVNVWFNLDVYK
jgi:hypothetical protein